MKKHETENPEVKLRRMNRNAKAIIEAKEKSDTPAMDIDGVPNELPDSDYIAMADYIMKDRKKMKQLAAGDATPKKKRTKPLPVIAIHGERIREYREYRANGEPDKFSVSALAKRAGITPRQWYRVENNQKPKATALTVARMCRAIELSVEYVLGMDERRPN